VSLTLGGITYSDDGTFTSKLTGRKNGEGDEKKAFEAVCASYGLQPEDYGKEISVGGRRFTVFGFKPRSSYPVLVREVGSTASSGITLAAAKVALGHSTREEEDRIDFVGSCYAANLKPEDFGKEFQSGPRRFRIVGVKCSRQGCNVVAEEKDGAKRRFLIPPERVAVALAAEPKETK
jgi:hypothetical protein